MHTLLIYPFEVCACACASRAPELAMSKKPTQPETGYLDRVISQENFLVKGD